MEVRSLPTYQDRAEFRLSANAEASDCTTDCASEGEPVLPRSGGVGQPTPCPRNAWPRRRRGAQVLAVLAFSGALVGVWRAACWGGTVARAPLFGVRTADEVKLQEDVCSKVENDTEFHTSRSLYWVSNIASPELCCAECDAVPDCVTFTYGTDDAVEGVARHCYLKSLGEDEQPQRINRSGLISGILVHKQLKHGVVSGMLAKVKKEKPEPGILGNQTCPGHLDVTGYGRVTLIAAKWHTPGNRAARVEVPYANWAVVPHIKGRAYFGDSCSVASTGKYVAKEYVAMRLLGNTLRYTVDLSQVGCGCNAQFYLKPMHQNTQESKCEDHYCGHGWQHCGVSCAEIGIQDANQYAWSTNLHLHDDSAGPASGYGGGGDGWIGRRNWESSQYGPGGECIDTSWPFDVEVAFPTWSSGLLKAVAITLTQEGRPCPLTVYLDRYHFKGRNGMVELTSMLKGGVTPVIQYFASADMSWLDGAGRDGQGPCVKDSPEACPATVRFYDFAVKRGLHGQEVRPTNEEPVLVSAINIVHEHMLATAAAAEKAELARLESEEEEKRRARLPNASREELARLEDGSQSKHEAENGAYMEWEDGNSQWECVAEESSIRNVSSFDGAILGRKVKGQVVAGSQQGNWVKLAQEPGYMAVSKDGEALLKQRIVAYEKIVEGSCTSMGMFVIEDSEICASAAFSLGYFDSSVHVSVNSHRESPGGCYLLNGQLFLSTSQANKGKGAIAGMDPICASVPFPTTTTTTTTITSTSTTTQTITSTSTMTATTMTTTSSTTWGYPSLFCIEVTRVHGYELPLVKAQMTKRASIFGCEEYAVFSDGGTPQTVGIGPDGKKVVTIVIPPIKQAIGDMSRGATTNSWLNTKTFLQVWDLVKKDGRYQNHDWIIKVDPDAVFFADRLRHHMRPHTMKYSTLFVMNCARFFPALYGSIEIFSKGALDTYLAGQWRCRNSLPWHGWGEDFFMSHCMDMLGVGRIYDFDLLSDKRCVYRPCGDTSRVAYHDYKDARLDGTWFKCWRESLHR